MDGRQCAAVVLQPEGEDRAAHCTRQSRATPPEKNDACMHTNQQGLLIFIITNNHQRSILEENECNLIVKIHKYGPRVRIELNMDRARPKENTL